MFRLVLVAVGLTAAIFPFEVVDAQQVTQPVYRVANDAAAGAAAAGIAKVDPAVQPTAGQNGSPFDLIKRQGEHDLMPFLRMAKQSLEVLDNKTPSYTAVLTKTERIHGRLGDQQQMIMKVRHQPFGVYIKFIQPNAGQEVLYPSVKNPGKLVALGAGWKRALGPFPLDPNGTLAMTDNRHPITEAGIRNLTNKIIKTAEAETKYANCVVRYSTSAKIDGRPTTMVEITHPAYYNEFKYHKTRVFFDNEHRIPVGYQAYSWPATQGGKPVLEKQYFYTRVVVNAGLTDEDFDESNPSLFK